MVADDPPRFANHGLEARVVQFVDGDLADALVQRPVNPLGRTERSPKADLDHARRIDKALFDGPSEGSRGSEPLAFGRRLCGVGVGVELDQGERRFPRQCPEDRKRDQVVAAQGDRRNPFRRQTAEAGFDLGQVVGLVEGPDLHVADIADCAKLEWRNAEGRMQPVEELRHHPDLARGMAGAHSNPRAAVPGHPDDRNVQGLEVGHVGKAHEGRQGLHGLALQCGAIAPEIIHRQPRPSLALQGLARKPLAEPQRPSLPRAGSAGRSLGPAAGHLSRLMCLYTVFSTLTRIAPGVLWAAVGGSKGLGPAIS